MAGQSDGSIIVDTELNSEGFRAGSAEMQRAVRSLTTAVNNLGPTFQKALSGSESAMGTFDAKAATLEQTIERIESEMERLGQTPVPTDQYTKTSSELEKLEAKFDAMIDKQEKMLATGVSMDSSGWKSLQYDIEACGEKIRSLRAEKEAMENSGTAFQMGSDTAQYQQMAADLAAAKARLEEMRSSTQENTGLMSRLAGAAKNVASGIGKAAQWAGGKLIGGLKAALSATKKLITSNKSYSSSFNGLISGAKKFALSLLGARGVYALLRKAVSAYMASNQELTNTLNSCWASIGNLLGPIITRVINLVASAVSYVTAFLKLLGMTGGAAAKAASTAGGAASKETDKLKRQLASFDELNILSDNKSDSGGGGGGADTASLLPDKELPDWAKLIGEQLKNGDWAGAAKTLTGKLNELVDTADWAGMGSKIGYYLNGALTFLATCIKTFDWNNLGKKLGTGINAILTSVDWSNLGTILGAKFRIIIEGLAGLFSTLDWAALGKAFGDCLRGIWESINWTTAAKGLNDGVIGLFTAIRTAIKSFDWAKAGSDVAQGINNIDWVGMLSSAAGTLSDAIVALLDLCIGFVETLDWGRLGQQIWDSIIGIITNIDWGGIISKAFQLLGGVIGGSAQLIWSLAQAIWDSLVEGFEATKAYFNSYIEEAGGNVIEGLWNGIVNALKNVGNWIVEHIWNPFIEGFKNAFGIHSPSTKMAEQGDFIIQGLLQGITNAWHTITSFFSNALSSIGSAISTAWSSIKSATSTAWNAVSTTISNAWSGIKTGVTNGYNAVKTGVSNAWNTVKTTTSTAWSNVKSGVTTAWNNIKSTTSSIGSSVASAVGNAWTNVKTHVTDKLNTAKANASAAWTSIKSTASTVGSNIASAASTAWSNVKNYVTNNLNTAKTNASTAWNNIKSNVSTVASSISSTVSSKFSSIGSTISSKVSSFKTTISNGFESAKSSITSKLSSAMTTIKNQGWSGVGSNICSGIASGIDSGWSWLKSKVSSVASSLLSAAKSALGIHSPSKLFRDVIGLNIGYGVGEGIEASEGSVLQSVNGVADAIADEFKDQSYTAGEIIPTAEIDGGLASFSDKISNSFSDLMLRLQAIADGVTFGTPRVAKGIVPYAAATAGAYGSGDVSGAIEASNDELASVVTQVVMNAANSIVGAIQNYSGTTVTLDEKTVATSVIKEINRRTRMMNQSPILT